MFEMTSEGAVTELYSNGFSLAVYTGPAQGTDGNLYGTNNCCGTHEDGTVWGLELGLSPFVKTVPIAGKVASKLKILGTSLTGVSSVTFNGDAPTFTVVSSTEISVPAGATGRYGRREDARRHAPKQPRLPGHSVTRVRS